MSTKRCQHSLIFHYDFVIDIEKPSLPWRRPTISLPCAALWPCGILVRLVTTHSLPGTVTPLLYTPPQSLVSTGLASWHVNNIETVSRGFLHFPCANLPLTCMCTGWAAVHCGEEGQREAVMADIAQAAATLVRGL